VILVGIGANLPTPDGAPPLVSCQRAVASLDELPGLRLRGLSRWWRSVPVPASDQPDYVNGVALLAGYADPAALLQALHAIEARFGRRRLAVNAARSLDLDLIDVDGLVRQPPDPVLPHPRAHVRAFVLGPLADVVPGWVHPTLRCAVEGLLADLPPQVAVPLALQPS
jgi:2-amino-4-hydroxy-6-hydroxymethyldihydropteridine diphosphokinase